MNKRMVIILGLGLVVSMVMAITLQALLSPGKQEVADAPLMKQVLIASKQLNIGDELSNQNMQWQNWPEQAVFSGAVVREEDQTPMDALNGRVIRVVQEGEPLLRTALVEESDGNILAAALKPGMRAMAIRVSAESSVGGFVTPGDNVDVILTYQVRIPSGSGNKEQAADIVSRNASQTVLENVRILAVDQEAKAKDGAKVGRTVTLEVDGKGTEILALASSMGSLSLVLRKLGETQEDYAAHDNKKTLTTDVLISNVLKQVTQGSGNRAQIRVYSGPNLEQQTVRAQMVRPLN